MLHHFVLLPHHHSGKDGRDTLNQSKDDSTHDGLLKSEVEATSDGEDSSCDESGNDSVKGVVLPSVENEQAVHGSVNASPHGKRATKQWSSIANMSQTAEESLSSGGIGEALAEIHQGTGNATDRETHSQVFKYTSWAR